MVTANVIPKIYAQPKKIETTTAPTIPSGPFLSAPFVSSDYPNTKYKREILQMRIIHRKEIFLNFTNVDNKYKGSTYIHNMDEHIQKLSFSYVWFRKSIKDFAVKGC